MFLRAIVLIALLQPIKTSAQVITPAPILSLRQLRSPGELQARSESYTGEESCYRSVPGCNRQLTLGNECQKSYGTSLIYLYCLCTNGYYDAAHSCDACLVKAGVYSTDFLSSELSLDGVACASLSYEYGPGASLTGFDGVTFETSPSSPTPSSTPVHTPTPSPSTPFLAGLPSSTFALTLDGSATGILPSIPALPTKTLPSSSTRNAGFSIHTWTLFAIACFASIGWTLTRTIGLVP